MNITIVSGKGGTGKTTIATNLALSLGDNVQLLDCDVEEPNDHLFIKPEILESEEVYVKVPEVDKARCVLCGRCQEVCAFNAIAVLNDDVLVFGDLCHSCGACSYFCPQKAIGEAEVAVGRVDVGRRDTLQFVTGSLNIGKAISIPVIKAVKAHLNPTRTVVIDAPPGTSCPVIESLKGSDYVLVVTEPTPFGFNDFELIVALLRKLALPFGVIINRSDLGSGIITDYCQKENISIVAQIPFKPQIALAYSQGKILVDTMPEMRREFQQIAQHIIGVKRT